MLRLMAFIMLAGISWNQAVILFYLKDLLARQTGWQSYLFAENCPLCGNASVVKALDELGVGVILEGERKCHGRDHCVECPENVT